MTKEQLATGAARLKAENERLGAEIAALRDLLTAVRAYADVPHPARYDDPAHEYELERRLDSLAVYADGDQDGMDHEVYLLVMGDRAKELRDRAARPVRYETRPAPVTDDKPADLEPLTVTDDEPEDHPDTAGPTYGEAELRRADAYRDHEPYAGHLRTPAIPAGPDDPNRLRLAESDETAPAVTR